MSNQTIHVLPLAINPGIDQGIALIVLLPQTLLSPATEKVVADMASGGAWVNRNPRQVSRAEFDRSTPGEICHAVIVVESTPPVLIGIVATYLPCGLNASQQVTNKRQSTSLGLV